METLQLFARRRQGIGLTALIDVVFILLMFFMLTSTFNQWKAVDFQSPVASADSDAPQPQRVVLKADGSLVVADGDVVFAAQQDITADAFAAERPVVLVPEAQSTVQAIVSSLERLKELGLAVTLGKALADPAVGSGQ